MQLTIRSTVRLNNGFEIPRLGLGVYRAGPGRETRDAVRWAFEAGYRHIDTAHAYGNEVDVGRAVRESGLARHEVFVTTKLRNEDHGYDRALAALDGSLDRLGLEFVDLYLVHWPVPALRLDSWRAMERLLADGRTRAIGVSNYMVRHLGELLDACSVVPAVNQIELSPYNWRSRETLVARCREAGIELEAYSPLTKGRKLNDPRLVRIARACRRTPAQVLVRWALQRGFVVIPKSSNRDRIRENAGVFDFELGGAVMDELDTFDEGLVTGWDPTHAP